jgi:hypothetical protein
MKAMMRKDTIRRIRKKRKQENWHEGLNCFFEESVRRGLERAQARMQ